MRFETMVDDCDPEHVRDTRVARAIVGDRRSPRFLAQIGASLLALAACQFDRTEAEGEPGGGGTAFDGDDGEPSGTEGGGDGASANVDGLPTEWIPGPEGGAAFVDVPGWAYQVYLGFNRNPTLLILDLPSAPGELDCQGDGSHQTAARVIHEPEWALTYSAGPGDDETGHCTVNVTTATGPGGRIAGTFSATVVREGHPDIVIDNGVFDVAVNP